MCIYEIKVRHEGVIAREHHGGRGGTAVVVAELTVLGGGRYDEGCSFLQVIFHILKHIFARSIGGHLPDNGTVLRQRYVNTFLSTIVGEHHMTGYSSERSAPSFCCGTANRGDTIAGIAGDDGIFVVYTGEGIDIVVLVISGHRQRVRHLV